MVSKEADWFPAAQAKQNCSTAVQTMLRVPKKNTESTAEQNSKSYV
nr:hypothetical protein [Chryseobacterium sp. 3008163]